VILVSLLALLLPGLVDPTVDPTVDPSSEQQNLVHNQVAKKGVANFKLTASNQGGHYSMPRRDNAIAQLARAVDGVSRFEFPTKLNDATRDLGAALQPLPIAAGFGALLSDLADFRAHWNNERVSVQAFAEGHEALYQHQHSLRTMSPG
jgi:hypothetical protein